MPLGVKPVCFTCKTTASTIWRKGSEGAILCNSCGLKQNGNGGSDGTGSEKGSSISERSIQPTGPVRKSTRIKPSKYKQQPLVKLLPTKGKNRRVIFKKNCTKAPTAVSTVITTEYVFYDGLYWQTGDVVSLIDVEGGVYYAQIRRFLQDQYCEKSAVISWLLPTTSSPKDRFDPSTYILGNRIYALSVIQKYYKVGESDDLGPEEELPRPMEAMEFVCRAPSEYYKSQNAPYPTEPAKPELGFIWTSIGPEVRRVPTQEEIFGLKAFGEEEGEGPKKTEKKGKKAKVNTDS